MVRPASPTNYLPPPSLQPSTSPTGSKSPATGSSMNAQTAPLRPPSPLSSLASAPKVTDSSTPASVSALSLWPTRRTASLLHASHQIGNLRTKSRTHTDPSTGRREFLCRFSTRQHVKSTHRSGVSLTCVMPSPHDITGTLHMLIITATAMSPSPHSSRNTACGCHHRRSEFFPEKAFD